MKQYVVDQIAPEDYEKLKDHLERAFGRGGMDGVYWVPLEDGVLSETQAAHGSCKPHVFSVCLEEGAVTAEFLVRTLNAVRCDCMGYACPRQQLAIIEFIDNTLGELGIQA